MTLSDSDPLLEESREPSGHEIDIVGCLSRLRKAEIEVTVLRDQLRRRGYTDTGMDRWVREHLAKLKAEARGL